MTDIGSPHAREHGGNLDDAMRRFGGTRADWIDLSTGINPVPYPIPPISRDAWTALPSATAMARLCHVARDAYDAHAAIFPTAGAQAAIQIYPLLCKPGAARVLGPTYNEHVAALHTAGWRTEQVDAPEHLAGADLAVVVNPNNPDGRRFEPHALMTLAGRVGLLIVDESFVDADPALSLAPHLEAEAGNIVVLRSFGKFYGLAGVRLGFVMTSAPLAARLAELAGPWPVSGPAIDIASVALADTAWQRDTVQRLERDAAQLDTLAGVTGWRLVGGTPLFRTYDAGDARTAQGRLARHHIWSRIFPYSTSWIRLGLAGSEPEWARLAAALTASD